MCNCVCNEHYLYRIGKDGYINSLHLVVENILHFITPHNKALL